MARFSLSKLFLAGVCALFASLVLDAINYARGLFGPSILSVIPIILILIGLGLIGYDFWRRMH
ncbi:hypothetical protein DYY65_08230 [Nitrososphaera sp. AFS]|nr:hypothetical protein [Nitrososphaera sp. AFS]